MLCSESYPVVILASFLAVDDDAVIRWFGIFSELGEDFVFVVLGSLWISLIVV